MNLTFFSRAVGILCPIAVWVVLSYLVGVPDGYLPPPHAVAEAFLTIDPSMAVHAAATAARVLVGLVAGTFVGLYCGSGMYRSDRVRALLFPTIQALRATPTVAVIPFFILWFGFSELGKFVLLTSFVAVAITIATLQTLEDMPYNLRLALKTLGIPKSELPTSIWLPLALSTLLPSLRVVLPVAVTTATVAELLGAQIGLGYVLQSARSTFAMNNVLAAAIMLALINATFDYTLVVMWSRKFRWSLK